MDQEHLDPEALLPLTHFSNNRTGFEQTRAEESKQSTRKGTRKLNINVQVPEMSSEETEPVNHLFNSKNPESILFRHKQEIVSKGLACKNDFPLCLKFIKGLSSNKTFEYSIKEH